MGKLEAWEYNDTQREDHKHVPNRPIAWEKVEELGVLCWKVDVEEIENNPMLESIKVERGYQYWETITVAPGQLEGYEAKSKQFYTEHLHPYDESRLILQGSGYWDIRNYNNEWIRFRVEKGDLIVLPPGMYHRFTMDKKNYIKAMLLYKKCPKRVDATRPYADELQARKDYVNFLLMRGYQYL